MNARQESILRVLKSQRFGVEDEMTGITRNEAAKALARCFGTRETYCGGAYGEWHIPDAQGKIWKIMSDSSIDTEMRANRGYADTDEGDYSVEMVTPILTYGEMDKLQEAIRALRRAGAKVNSSCGMHCHIDGANHDQKSIRNLLSIVYGKEELLFKACRTSEDRVRRWCKPVDEKVLSGLRRATSTTPMNRIAQIWYDGNRSDHTSHYDNSRYHAVNLHSLFTKGTIEFRLFNATLHAGEVRSAVVLCLAISTQAILQRGSRAHKLQTDNDKYAMRVWLLRMGMIGKEFENVRAHLIKHLDGNAAYRYPDKMKRRTDKSR